jgi:hypothetical protein
MLAAATAGVAAFAAMAGAAWAAGEGAAFGTRDPATCDDRSQPVSGEAMTPDLAARYLACDIEGNPPNYLYLAENIRVKVGHAREYRLATDSFKPDIDDQAPVWPIRGSYDRYQCSSMEKYGPNNCNLYRVDKAEGACFRTVYDEWMCHWYGADSETKMNVPPPG